MGRRMSGELVAGLRALSCDELEARIDDAAEVEVVGVGWGCFPVENCGGV